LDERERGERDCDPAAIGQRWHARGFLASRTNAFLSIPMLFFMAAASHYPMFGK